MRVVVFGLGYVGSVTSACLAHLGHRVTGVDIDDVKVSAIRAGHAPVVEERLDEMIAAGVESGRLNATDRAVVVASDADVSIVCVGTPSGSHGSVDTSALRAVTHDIGTALAGRAAGHVVIFRSTMLPGTVEEQLVPILESTSGGRAGEDFHVAMCPEFLRESSGVADFFDPPFTAVGTEHDVAMEVATQLFDGVGGSPIRLSTKAAETLKYTCNAFHALKVSFANEVGRFCHEIGVDSREVMHTFCLDRQLNISPYYLRPGFSFGGSCLPKDVRALSQRARTLGIDLPVLSGILPSNEVHLRDAIDRVLASGPKRVALLGLTFKEGTDDLRESPFVELAETLLGKGVELRICDPDVDPSALRGANLSFVTDRLPHLAQLLVANPIEALNDADAVIVGTTNRHLQDALEWVDPTVPILDLTGRLDDRVESLDGFRGLSW